MSSIGTIKAELEIERLTKLITELRSQLKASKDEILKLHDTIKKKDVLIADLYERINGF